MNRAGLGLAVGAGYLLGRTRKLKLALAVGALAAGKRMNPGPRSVAELLSRQLRDNPQFKEIGDQLRQDLRGVGRAASGAVIERRLDALADRLHSRASRVRDQAAGGASKTTGAGGSGSRGAEDPESRDDGCDDGEHGNGGDRRPGERRRAPRGRGAEKKDPPRTAKKAARKTAAAGRTAGRTARPGPPKGGDER
ncbi:hypothetical protein SUDANB6_00789 [Streptomyces sp. enrichment culture]|uniref:DNA primase n=1 Tax=Streptomyces sp. enrichment culture TaxID=1795815 RepID=UPI003F57DDD5